MGVKQLHTQLLLEAIGEVDPFILAKNIASDHLVLARIDRSAARGRHAN
jgi:hypothetical protein